MSDPVDALVLDLLEWIGSKPRPYLEVIEAWRNILPALTCVGGSERQRFH